MNIFKSRIMLAPEGEGTLMFSLTEELIWRKSLPMRPNQMTRKTMTRESGLGRAIA
jgi:hypothetical protein